MSTSVARFGRFSLLVPVFFAFGGFSTQGQAQTVSDSPVLHCDNGELVCARVNSAGYDLSGFSIPFEVNWPIEPITTSVQNVSTMAGLRAAVAGSNVLINVAPGVYSGGLTNWGNDIDIVMDNGATLVGNITMDNGPPNGPSRIRWTGGNIEGNHAIRNTTDLLFDNVYFNGTGGGAGIQTGGTVRRLAIINSTMTSTTGNMSWVIFTNPWTGFGPVRHSDFILANTRLFVPVGSSSTQTIRLNEEFFDRVIVVDTVINETGFRDYGWRSNQINNLYMANVINIGNVGSLFMNWDGGSNWSNAVSSTNFVAENVDVYNGTHTLWSLANSVGSGSGVVRNSRLHTTARSPSFTIQGGFTNGGGNDVVSWDRSPASVDFSRMPGKNSFSDYGADH